MTSEAVVCEKCRIWAMLCALRLSSQFEFKGLSAAWKSSKGSFPSGRGDTFLEQSDKQIISALPPPQCLPRCWCFVFYQVLQNQCSHSVIKTFFFANHILFSRYFDWKYCCMEEGKRHFCRKAFFFLQRNKKDTSC